MTDDTANDSAAHRYPHPQLHRLRLRVGLGVRGAACLAEGGAVTLTENDRDGRKVVM